MSTKEPFSNPIYEEQMHLAERELSTFCCAVTELVEFNSSMTSAEVSQGDEP